LTETQAETSGKASSRTSRSDILERIVATKRKEVAVLEGMKAELERRAGDAPAPRDFRAALTAPGTVDLIAEVKRRSPGAGAIRPDLDPVDLAERYSRNGASAISVLTDREYFGGALEDLERIRQISSLPILRKDFLVSPLQVLEARAAGADAILLIVRILDDTLLRELRLLAESLGMAALVEVHDKEELRRATASGAGILGINNRDLATFTTRLEVTIDLLPEVPEDVVLVSESGIGTEEDVRRLGAAGVDAILVGEALLREEDPGRKSLELSGLPRRRSRGKGDRV